MNFQIVGYILGILLVILGVAELVPAMLDFIDGHSNAHIFLYCSAISTFMGGVLFLGFRDGGKDMDLRQGFLLTTIGWLFLGIFCALPLQFSNLHLSFTDAFFESASGITTTGSTILVGLDKMSRGVLMWRALMHWIGGIGIIGFAIILFPFLRIGGMQLFRMESSDKSDKIMPKTSELIASLTKVYLWLTLACTLCYVFLGMSWFDAVTHAMATISTGGFSTHDASYAFFNSYALDMAGAFFMFLGGLPFMLYVQFLYQRKFRFHEDSQVRFFFWMVLSLTAVMTAWLTFTSSYGWVQSFRYALFNIVSVLTTTGFSTTDYLAWGPFAGIFFLLITYLGACAGSTAGGIKTIRLAVTASSLGAQLKRLVYPHGVFHVVYQGKAVDTRDVYAILGFLTIYVITNGVATMLLGLCGLDPVTALSAAATAIANVGPGISAAIGPVGNFSALPDAAKWILSISMLLGRLEIMTVLVLFTPWFWRK